MERLPTHTSTSRQAMPYLPQYLLVAYPDAETCNALMHEKQLFTEMFNDKDAVKTAPAIIISEFSAKEFMEDSLLRYMYRILAKQQSFKVALNNYSGFPSGTIHLRVQENQQLEQLSKQLQHIDNFIEENECGPVIHNHHPHLSIACNLHKLVYDKAMLEFSRRVFHAEFNIDELVLLKRNNPFDTCKQVTVFKLWQRN